MSREKIAYGIGDNLAHIRRILGFIDAASSDPLATSRAYCHCSLKAIGTNAISSEDVFHQLEDQNTPDNVKCY